MLNKYFITANMTAAKTWIKIPSIQASQLSFTSVQIHCWQPVQSLPSFMGLLWKMWHTPLFSQLYISQTNKPMWLCLHSTLSIYRRWHCLLRKHHYNVFVHNTASFSTAQAPSYRLTELQRCWLVQHPYPHNLPVHSALVPTKPPPAIPSHMPGSHNTVSQAGTLFHFTSCFQLFIVGQSLDSNTDSCWKASHTQVAHAI